MANIFTKAVRNTGKALVAANAAAAQVANVYNDAAEYAEDNNAWYGRQVSHGAGTAGYRNAWSQERAREDNRAVVEWVKEKTGYNDPADTTAKVVLA